MFNIFYFKIISLKYFYKLFFFKVLKTAHKTNNKFILKMIYPSLNFKKNILRRVFLQN